MSTKIGIENGKYVMPSKVAGVLTPTERITDGDFENQNTFETPDGFVMLNIVADANVETNFAKSATAQAGSYALQLTCAYDSGDGSYLSPTPTFFDDTVTGGETVQVRTYARQLSGANSALAVAQFAVVGGTDYVYNLTAGDWIEFNGGGDDGNNYEIVALSGGASYTQYTSTQRTLPVSSTEAWANVLLASTVQNETGLLDGLEFLVDGADVLTEGGFENWTTYASQSDPLNDWTYVPTADGEFMADDLESSDYIDFTTDGADNVVKMVIKSTGNANRAYIYGAITRPAGTSLDLSAAVETKTSASQTPYLIALDGAPSSHTQIWDFVTGTWDTASTTVTDLPGTDNAKTLSGTESFVSNDAGDITVPDSGVIALVLMSDDGNSPTGQYEYYFKTASAIENVSTGGSSFVGLDVSSATDSTDLEATDYIEKIHTTGGTPAVLWGIKKTGEVESDVITELDFDTNGIDLKVSTPVADTEPATKGYTDNLVKTGTLMMVQKTAVDYKSVASTLLYTVPAGYAFIPFHYATLTTVATAPNNDSSSTIGTNGPGYDNMINPTQPPSSSADVASPLRDCSQSSKLAAGTAIYIKVVSADTGTALNADVLLYGTLIAV